MRCSLFNNIKRQTVSGISKYTKVIRFATPGRLFASCNFEMLEQPRATNDTFRWAKRISTISTYFPHFEMLGRLLSRILRCLRFLISTVSNTAKMSRFATPARSTPSQNWGQRSELQRQTVPGISTYTKVVRFATPGRLFASCSFEMLAQPRATHATFRWAKRISTISTHFPHFEMLGLPWVALKRLKSPSAEQAVCGLPFATSGLC